MNNNKFFIIVINNKNNFELKRKKNLSKFKELNTQV